MKLILGIISIFLFSLGIFAREDGETEITTEDGIEVFQNEKFYLLKKNVKIISDDFTLNADDVKIDFGDNLYDIIELNAKGNIDFFSNKFKIKGSGELLKFEVKIEKLKVEGQKSELITEDVKMFSDDFIEINNLNGEFSLRGKGSKLINENILIEAEEIDGIFSDLNNKREITFLKVFDKELSYIKNNETRMYAKKINYDNKNSIIELIDNVTIIRNEEKITGDYGTLDTTNNSYKIKSNNKSKVKVVIQNNE